MKNRKQLTLFGSNGLYVSLYDITGAPLDPGKVNALVTKAEELAQAEANLAVNVVSK